MSTKRDWQSIVPLEFFRIIVVLAITLVVISMMWVLVGKTPDVRECKPKIIRVCYICPNLSCGSMLSLLSECNFVNALATGDAGYLEIK